MYYSGSEIVDILVAFGETGRNYRAAARVYRRRYPNRLHHPSASGIRYIEMSCRRGRIRQFGRPRQVVRDPHDPRIIAVLAYVHLNPHASVRDIERNVGIPRSTAHRILATSGYHPYHVRLTQQLTAQDRQNRVIFCQWALQKLEEDPNFFRYVAFSDEATFQSIGTLNRHNCHYWSETNPHWMQSIDHQHRWSVNVWCGILDGHVIGPYFFDGTVTGEKYLEFLRSKLPVLLEDVCLQTRQRMWFQQDGAPPHFARNVRTFLNNRFRERWIGRSGFVEWPSRSPDLTPLDFYLWGYLKNVVYKDRPTTPENLKRRIIDAINSIPPGVLLSTVENFRKRLQLCLEVNGGNIEQLL